LGNYQHIVSDPVFWKAVYNTLYIGIVAHIPMLFLALLLAFIVNSGMIRFKELFRTIYFLPVITSSVAVSIVFLSIFGVRAGLINYVLSLIGLPQIEWWGGHGQWVKPAIIFLFIWKWLGWNMVIYLAGLQAIPKELYEAAEMDGASVTNIFFRITLPLLKPVILFTLILSTIGALTIFDEPYNLVGTNGGTDNAGLTLMLYLYREAFEYVHFGYASAIAYFVSLFIVVISIVNMKLFGKSNT
jgi:cellobiose transport system permease protein